MSIIPEIAQRQAALETLRRDFHAHPEIAFGEHRTAAKIAALLRGWGLEVHEGIGRTGVVGVLRRGSGPRIGLRADMDALPIEEANDFAHRSRHAGCMHACGHDGHATMLLGAAEYLAAHGRFAGELVFIFQPAEEGLGGAAEMIADGLLERFPLAAVYGMHNWPGLAAGHFSITPGPVMASADRFDIHIAGHGGHAAMPHLTCDPIVAGAALVQAMQTLVARRVDPLEAAVVSVTRFQAGEAYNAIPGTALLCGTLRTLKAEVRALLWRELQQLCDGVAAAHGVGIELVRIEGYPPTVNDAQQAQRCHAVASALVGEACVSWGARPSMGAEDFSYFLERLPGCYVWLGNGPGEGGCTLHNARYDFNDANLAVGASYWARLAETLLPAG